MLWIAISLGTAHAQDAPVDPEVQRAEAVRLTEEIKRAAQKNAWKGVERHYVNAAKTGQKLSAEVHIAGARAARHVGDLGAVRERMVAALAVEPTNAEALAEVTALERQYARVQLYSIPGAVLEDYERPFDPLKLKAVDHAIATMKATGVFEGLLPPGPYALNADPFELAAGQVFSLDLRPETPPEPVPVPVWKR